MLCALNIATHLRQHRWQLHITTFQRIEGYCLDQLYNWKKRGTNSRSLVDPTHACPCASAPIAINSIKNYFYSGKWILYQINAKKKKKKSKFRPERLAGVDCDKNPLSVLIVNYCEVIRFYTIFVLQLTFVRRSLPALESAEIQLSI